MDSTVLTSLGLVVAGLACVIAGGDLVVRGAARLAAAMSVPATIIGLTIVGFGTSAPELVVTVWAALQGQNDLALGNVVGSNILNILLVLGLAAVIAPLVVQRRLLRIDIPIMVASLVVLAVFGAFGGVPRWAGVAMLAALAAYLALTARYARSPALPDSQAPLEPGVAAPAAVPGGVALSVVQLLVGLVLLPLGSKWLIDGCVYLAEAWGISQMVVGMTILALGTSLPEVAVSVVAAVRGQRDIALANVVGSNTFNTLGVLAAAAVAAGEVRVPRESLTCDLPVMLLAAAACWGMCLTGRRVGRLEGALLLACYVAFTVYRALVLG